MIILGLDTCLSACSVAVLDGARVLAARSEVMARGHQERLAPMAQAVMAEAGLPFSAIRRLGVTVGPGSFTGLRVGVAFAKGLAAALVPSARLYAAEGADARDVARLAAGRQPAPLKPLYLRAPDAKLPA
jgi:tRNA threonylcarbamoyladenosine biosynthesis protein TsaB